MRFFKKIKRNFYAAAGCIFLIWIFFFDMNDLISQLNNYVSYKKLEKTKSYYEEKIVQIEGDIKSLRTNPKKLEKFAREKYLMKKENEEVFLIEVEEEKP